jgi:hypothetical protein
VNVATHSGAPGSTRRAFLERVLSAGACALPWPAAARAEQRAPKKLAAIVYGYALRWHPDNIVTRLLEGYWINDEFHEPRCRIVSLYTRVRPEIDLSRRLARAYGFELQPSITAALTLSTGRLAVDGVIVVSESHGLIPFDDNPYREFFDEIVQVFRRSGRSVPVFNDKHLSHSWEESKSMVAQSRELGFPMLAGSTLPVTFRRPEVEFPLDTTFEEVMAVSSLPGEHLQSYGYHGIELVQSMVERRRGGETGVRAVRYVDGPEVLEAQAQGAWSRDLLEAALQHSPTRGGRSTESLLAQAMAFLIEYRDGLRGSVILIPVIRDFNFAARTKPDRKITSFVAYIPWENSNNFSCLVRCAERLFETGKPDYPIERTLLASGTLDFLMRSKRQGHRRLETPELAVSYRAPASSSFCRGPGS